MFALSTEPSPGQEYGLRREGFEDGHAVILGFYLAGERNSSADPYHWGARTMPNAHNYITENFDTLSDGDVVDVRVILGEATEAVKSDRFFRPGQ